MTFPIVFHTDGGASGGSEELWTQAAARIAQLGHQVHAHVSPYSRPHKLYDLISDAGGIVTAKPRISLLQRIGRKLGLIRSHKWLIKDRLPSLVVCNSPGHPIMPYIPLECIKQSVPYVVIVQAASDVVWPEPDWTDIIRQVYTSALACFFVSHGNQRLVEWHIGTRLRNAVIVHNPFLVPYNDSPPWPHEHDKFKLACVARLNCAHKGQDILLDVLAQSKWRNRPLEVAFFGTGPHGGLLKQYVHVNKVDNAHFKGHTTNIQQVWSHYHGLILPSRSEGLPLALVESALSDRMAIVTDVAGNAEVVIDNVTGFVASAPKPSLLDEALERAWARRFDWHQIGTKAGQHVRTIVPPDPVGKFADILLNLSRISSA